MVHPSAVLTLCAPLSIPFPTHPSSLPPTHDQDTIGGLFGGSDPSSAAAPAGVPDDADISEVGDFKALHERIHKEAQETKDTVTSSSPGDAAGDAQRQQVQGAQKVDDVPLTGDISGRSGDSSGGGDMGAAMGDAMQQGVEKMKEAGDTMAGAVGGDTSASTGGGLLGGLGQLVSDIATKVRQGGVGCWAGAGGGMVYWYVRHRCRCMGPGMQNKGLPHRPFQTTNVCKSLILRTCSPHPFLLVR